MNLAARTSQQSCWASPEQSKYNSELVVFAEGQQGLIPLAALPVTGAISSILFGEFGDAGPDAAFLAGGKIQILRSSTLRLTPVSLPVSAVSMALGSFVFDRNGGSTDRGAGNGWQHADCGPERV